MLHFGCDIIKNNNQSKKHAIALAYMQHIFFVANTSHSCNDKNFNCNTMILVATCPRMNLVATCPRFATKIACHCTKTMYRNKIYDVATKNGGICLFFLVVSRAQGFRSSPSS